MTFDGAPSLKRVFFFPIYLEVTIMIFNMPESGYGDFQDHYDAIHIAVQGMLGESNLHWLDQDGEVRPEYEDECASTCDSESRKYVILYIESKGYTIEYP